MPSRSGRAAEIKAALKTLEGLTIERAMLDKDGTLVLMLDGGAYEAAIMADPEGNGPGSLHLYADPNEAPTIIGGR